MQPKRLIRVTLEVWVDPERLTYINTGYEPYDPPAPLADAEHWIDASLDVAAICGVTITKCRYARKGPKSTPSPRPSIRKGHTP